MTKKSLSILYPIIAQNPLNIIALFVRIWYHIVSGVVYIIRIAIVDDEKEQVSLIKKFVTDFCEQRNMEYKILPFYCGEALLKCNIPIDVAFLDVQMGKIDGIETAQRLCAWNKWVALIYVTSYGEYITKAMTIHPFSYITKPFQPEQISKVLEEFLEYQHSVNSRTKEYFQLNTNNSCRYLEINDIYYFYYLKDRTVEVKLRRESYKIKDSITNIYNIVNHRCFIMPTPSTIINIQHIRKIDGKNKKLILENDDEILISRRKYKEVFDALNSYITNG